MRIPRPALAAILAPALVAGSIVWSGSAAAFDGVVASIKPVHSLVAAVMEGVGTPTLLVKGAGSPHTYALRPSEARALQHAQLVFWVGPGLEAFLTRPLDTLAGSATIVELSHADDLVRLGFREGGPFEAHDHDDHEHEHEHEHHDHDDHHEHDDDHASPAQDHAEHAGIDMHLWLDPVNAKVFVHEIEVALAQADPDNAAAYAANAAAVSDRLDALITETSAALAPVKGKGFIVFHDAYQYFETRFGISASGSLTVSPEAIPGAQRLDEMHQKLAELGVACIFAEPQFEPRLVSVIAEGTAAKTGVLDPLGAEIADGPELYFELIRTMTTALTTCLAQAG